MKYSYKLHIIIHTLTTELTLEDGGPNQSIWQTDRYYLKSTVTFSVLWHLVCGAQLSGEQQLIALKLSKLYFQSLSEQCNLK